LGLPLAVAFGQPRDPLGRDLDANRISELRRGKDRTLEVDTALLASAQGLRPGNTDADLVDRDVFIVAVPTPINGARRRDLSGISAGSRAIGRHLKPGAVVIYEPAVYPGPAEEFCVPILKQSSGLSFKPDFLCGYSPERANPGDRDHRLATNTKVTTGSTPDAARFFDALYRSMVLAGTHLASSIRAPEAAQVVENTQRNLNIALINAFALILNRLGLDTLEVLEAAWTTWNLLPYRPGLVGGHCIAFDSC
jgi:UDP-N-acetyl-D-galactosamine dehydrogenase